MFETEVHNTITEGEGIFKRGDKVAIGASGGKGELRPFEPGLVSDSVSFDRGLKQETFADLRSSA